jgi:hypothetical protein
VLRQLAHPYNLHAGLGYGVIILDRASIHADGSDQNAILIHDGQTPWEGDQAVIGYEKIDLASDRFFPRGYEAGHAFGCEYQLASLPVENALLDDLKEAVRLYRVLILRGGGTILSDEDAAEAGLEKASITEKRRY